MKVKKGEREREGEEGRKREEEGKEGRKREGEGKEADKKHLYNGLVDEDKQYCTTTSTQLRESWQCTCTHVMPANTLYPLFAHLCLFPAQECA